MHYKNGREAKIGDKIVHRDPYSGNPTAGILSTANAQSNSCNGTIHPLRPQDSTMVTLSECLHVDDVFPPPATK